jgi:hypothetical protein
MRMEDSRAPDAPSSEGPEQLSDEGGGGCRAADAERRMQSGGCRVADADGGKLRELPSSDRMKDLRAPSSSLMKGHPRREAL